MALIGPAEADLAVSGTPDVVCLSACTANPLDPLGQFNIAGGYFATAQLPSP